MHRTGHVSTLRASGCKKAASVLALLLISSIALASPSASPTSAGSSKWSIRWQPAKLVNGSPMIFRVMPPTQLTGLSGRWLGHELFFSFDPKSRSWYGIAGIGLETKPGLYPLQLTGATGRGKDVVFENKIAVKKATYPSIAITVAKQYTEPSAEQLKETAQDKTVKQNIFNQISPQRQWSGNFLPPVDARISDVFGTQRKFNGEVKGTHQGLDFAVPAGTPVAALNSGKVVLARFMFFEGNCVVIDHGQGLMSLYLHFSEFKVREGDQVNRGQEIGLSGGTGRATGPHLHIAVRWQGVYLSPATLLSLQMPGPGQ
jgi:murein DD-endopeptidase MepM/ murein hydrolase activator NlpD